MSGVRTRWRVRGMLAFAFLLMPLTVPVAHAASPLDRIVFSSSRDGGEFDLYKMNPDGSGVERIKDTAAFEGQPSLSPDGTRVAFSRGFSPQDEITAIGTDGTGEYELVSCHVSGPAWSPDGQWIAFAGEYSPCWGGSGEGEPAPGIWAIRADGSGGLYQVAVGFPTSDPTWSPDGKKIAYSQSGEILVTNADGSGDPITITNPNDGFSDQSPDWSPDGSKLAFDRKNVQTGAIQIFTMNPDGTGQAAVPNTSGGGAPAWSPDGTRLAFVLTVGTTQIHTINPDGSNRAQVTGSSGSNNGPDWGPVATGYARPKGGSPVRAALATAYEPCAAPDRTHGPPLAFGSCSSLSQVSDYLTVGTGDSNAKPAKSEGFVGLTTIVGVPGTPADEADVALRLELKDVRRQSDLEDYAGELLSSLSITATDRQSSVPSGGPITTVTNFTPVSVGTPAPHGLSTGDRVTISGVTGAPCANGTWTVTTGSSAGGFFSLDGLSPCGTGSGGTWTRTDPVPPPGAGTTPAFPLSFAAPCTPTADMTIGALCSVSTSADAVIPGSVVEGKRTIWRLGRIEVFDGGSDGDAETTADNTLFATQGVFVP